MAVGKSSSYLFFSIAGKIFRMNKM